MNMPEKVFTDPSSIANAYDNNVSTEFREGVTYANTADLPLLNAFFDHLPQSARVLDVGVGPAASFSLTAAQRGFNVSLQDGSPQVLESAVNSFAVADLPLADARIGVLPEIPFGDGEFDAAMCIHVLHHLERKDVNASVKDMARVLGASGYLAIIMSTSPDSETHQEPYEIGDGEFVQRNFHPKEQLHTAFAEAGLELVGEESVMDPEDTKEVPMPVSTFILRKSLHPQESPQDEAEVAAQETREVNGRIMTVTQLPAEDPESVMRRDKVSPTTISYRAEKHKVSSHPDGQWIIGRKSPRHRSGW